MSPQQPLPSPNPGHEQTVDDEMSETELRNKDGFIVWKDGKSYDPAERIVHIVSKSDRQQP